MRARARAAIDTFHRAGIRTVMITGDQVATAVAVATELACSRAVAAMPGSSQGPANRGASHIQTPDGSW